MGFWGGMLLEGIRASLREFQGSFTGSQEESGGCRSVSRDLKGDSGDLRGFQEASRGL